MLLTKKERDLLRSDYRYKQTNETWNKFRLNNAWTIGLMSLLISQKTFKNFQEWENYYFESGRKRQEAIEKLNKEKATKLRQLTANYSNPYRYKNGLTIEEVQLNENFGRTLGELKYISKEFKSFLDITKPNLKYSEKECFNYVYIRVIDEIYVGYLREENTIKQLRKLYKNLEFVRTDFETDRRYAVDVEVVCEGKLLCGLQIKSSAYRVDKSSILKETKKFNNDKNEKYKEITGVDVHYAYSTVEGYIQNGDVFKILHKLNDITNV